MGQLIPISAMEALPGDTFELGNELVVRFAALIRPILHSVMASIRWFFVPNRLTWEFWEDFITGGVDGDDTHTLPVWTPLLADTAVGTLWDYFGLPVGVVPTGSMPLAFPKRAYVKIWNDWYRDETQQEEADLDEDDVRYVAWEKDFLTSALPEQQRGLAPALPVTISGTGSADFPLPTTAGVGSAVKMGPTSAAGDHRLLVEDPGGQGALNVQAWLGLNTIDGADFEAASFDISDLRTAAQTQLWMEANARAGVRYPEFLQEHFDVFPEDSRLQRSEYIGGLKVPVQVSEVLQTSSTDLETPQGNMAGHGLAADRGTIGKYHCKEHGWIIGLMSVMPTPMYQQGIPRELLRRTRYDYAFPEFAGLSEQAVERVEVYASAVEAENHVIFGYQGRYNEYRWQRNMVCGLMRTDFSFWHLGRIFSAAPELNAEFITGIPDKRIFAVPTEPGLVVHVANAVRAIRPLPLEPVPGRMDHRR